MDHQQNEDAPMHVDGNPVEQPRSWLAANGAALAFVAGIVGLMVYKGVDFTAVGLVALGLGLVIFIHELGHFVAAKLCDVHVEAFSIGFGPSLPGCEYQKGETTYKIGLIPLGGYVKMVGEGTDTEEGEDDPRSFKNKSVGQRMVIISAGVVMNMLLAVVGFVGVYMAHGADRLAGVIGQVDAGSPSWQVGLRSGAELKKIGSIENPYFDDLQPEIVLSAAGDKVPLSFKLPGQTSVVDVTVEPRFDEEVTGRHMIGVSPSFTTSIRGEPRLKIPAFVQGSAASQAKPELQSGDRIVATTDPAQAAAIAPLPADPRRTDKDQRDYFELYRRFVDLAGQPITLQVERKQVESPVNVEVPPAFHRDLGLRMKMGQVVALRNGSPAARAGVQPRTSDPGDTIKQVELAKPGGGVIRYVTTHSAKVPDGVEERMLDPMRLPFELEQWAATASTPKKVKLSVVRRAGHAERTPDEVVVDWEDGWKYAREIPLSIRSPLSIPGLGLAYRVETVVEDVIPGSTAEKAEMKPGDVIKEVRYYSGLSDKDGSEKWQQLKEDQWAHAFWLLNEAVNPTQIDVRFKRGDKLIEAALEPSEDTTWPQVMRGLIFDQDRRLQLADSPGQALSMGATSVLNTAVHIYRSLKSLVKGDISFNKNTTGPFRIATTAYNVAGDSLPKFILFLAILSVNLAVINFLPIPVLDGGHMVFLLYEKFRGRPAPESVRVAATFAGVAVICSLMLYVIVLDVKNIFF